MSNPYELRFSILSTAREMLEREQDIYANAFWQIENKLMDLLDHCPFEEDDAYHGELNKFTKKVESLVTQLQEQRPQPITVDMVTERAEELYEFVQRK